MSKITKSVQGKPCYLHLDGCQSGGENETTVFAHLNGAGMGMKNRHKESGMEWGAPACFNCHNLVDRRTQASPPIEPEWLELCLYRATFRYQICLVEEELITCK
jgi:hypothetical protein